MKQTITLIVPTYNEGPFIDRCINSIKNQTVPFDRVIIIDDCSTDGSAERLDSIKEPGWSIIKHESNEGVSSSRNTGLFLAQTDWVTFLDADDELLPDACAKMHEAIKKHGEETGWIQFNHLRHYASIKKTVKKYWNPEGWIDIKNLHDNLCWWGVWNKLVKRSDIYWSFNEEMRYGEDGIWVLRHLLEEAKIWQVNKETVIHHFENPNSLTKSKTAEQLDMLEDKLRYLLWQNSSQADPYENIKAIIGCIDSVREKPVYKEIRK